MSNILSTTVKDRIENGYEFDLGKYISDGFKIFSKEWLQFSLYGLVVTLILTVSIFTFLGFALLLYPSILGFSIVANKAERDENIEFSDFFKGFNKIGQLFPFGLLISFLLLFIFVPYVAFIFIMVENPENTEMATIGLFSMMIFMFVLVMGSYFLQAALFFAPYLIYYGDYKTGDAIKSSFALAKKKFGWMVLFIFIVGVISGIGQYACFIGLFASVAIGILMQHVLVRDVLMNETNTEIDEIGSSSSFNG